MLPQLTNMIANSVLQDPDPENADIRPIMSQLAQQLAQSGVDPTAVQSLVSAAGKQALQMVASLLDSQEQEKVGTPQEDTKDVSAVADPIAPDATGASSYGYYDANPGMAETDDEAAAMDDVMYGSNAALQESPVAAMGMQVDDDYSGYEAFVNQMRYGGAQGKRKYMKEAMASLAKAAEGMQQQSGNTAALRGTANDIQGKTLTSKDTFIPAVKQIAQEQVNKQFAEQQYNNMMNQKFQFGGSNRRIRRANTAMFGTPFAPPGANTNYNFGPLGGLRSASVEFDPRMLQSMFGATSVMPGMISGQSGWYTPTYQIKGTRVKSSSETSAAQAAKAVNAASMDQVSKDTPNSAATSKEKTQAQQAENAVKVAGTQGIGNGGGSAVGTANSELNQGTNGNGTSGGNNAASSNRPIVPNPVRTPKPVVPVTPPVVTPKPKVPKYDERKDYEYYVYSPFDTNTKDTKIPDSASYRFNKVTKKWEKQMPSGKYLTLTDPDGSRTKKLNKFVKTGNPNFEPVYIATPEQQIQNAQRLNTLPMAAQADDELISTLVLGAGNYGINFAKKLLLGNQLALPQGQNPNMLNPGQGMLNPGQGMLNRGQGMLNPGQKMLDPLPGFQYNLGFATGGAINPNRYEYGFGGSDITQDDMDYTQSKDVSDPYFRDGGLYHFDGEEDSEVVEGQNAAAPSTSGLTKEEVQKMFDEYSKKMQTQYGQQQTGQQTYGSFGSAGVGQPMWGRPMYGRGYPTSGMFGQFGNMYSPYTRDFKYLSPYTQGQPGKMAINPNALMAGSLANIQKSGMVPTKMTYSKERKQDGNFFERKLGFNKDKVWTVDYSKPGAQPGAAKPLGLPATWDQTKKPTTGAEPIGQGAVPGAEQKMNAQEYMQSQLTLPGQQGNSTSQAPAVPFGFPANNVGPVNTEMAYGGYMPMAFAYGGDIPEYLIAGEVNNQAKAPSAIPYWVTNPMGAATNNIVGGCTDEQKKDPASPCYEKETEQLKFKENTAGTINYDNIMNSAVAGARSFTNNAEMLQDMTNTYVPETQKLIYDRMTPQQRKYTGKWDENSGTQNKMGFEGVVKKGGTTGLKANGEYQLTMDEIQHILRSGGKIEFL
jgi:hypothetical protein